MPLGFEIGPLTIRFYGVILMSGALAAAWLSGREAKRRKLDTEFVWDGLIWVLIGGIVGARIWHVLTPQPSLGITAIDYLKNPLDILAIWRGGLGIPGAVIGGGLALYLLCRRRGQSFAQWADVVAPAVALGQAIGRWGNFINQELYGPPTDLPWGIFIDRVNRLPEYVQYERFHPLFLYESLWNLANMVFLLWVGRRFFNRAHPGDIFLTYLITYPLGRFLLEFIRLDSHQIGSLNTNQTFMLLVALTSAGMLFWRHRKKRKKSR